MSWRGLYLRLAVLIVLMAVAGAVGLWMGERSIRVPEQPALAHETEHTDGPKDRAAPQKSPCYFWVRLPGSGADRAVTGEISIAAAAGIHQYVLSVPLPWHGEMQAMLSPIETLRQLDPNASMLLYLQLDPPAAWFAANPGEAVHVNGKPTLYVSLASDKWRQDTYTTVEALAKTVHAALTPGQLLGYVIGCHDEGRWRRTEGHDQSQANTAGFRRWLQARYENEATLRTAWNDAQVTFDTAAIPETPAADAGRVFPDVQKMQAAIDFAAYTSEMTADAIASIAAVLRRAAGPEAKIIAMYGPPHGRTADSDRFALSRLLGSELTGFAGPVSYHDRGLGGVGGAAAPVNSVLLHGKEWYLIDDTRTGIARDPVTGEITRPRNVQPEDIYNVQQRNFAAAITGGLGLFWSDSAGDARLYDEGMWRRFSRMSAIYQSLLDAGPQKELSTPTLALVEDGDAPLMLDPGGWITETMTNGVRESALRAGIRTREYLLEDVIEGRAPPAQVYVFFNVFHLSDTHRDRIHEILQEQKSAALWMYAPGYWNGTYSADNVAATVRMKVKQFDGPATAGSKAMLSGRYLEKDMPLGQPITLDPLFYVDDVQTNEIARFTSSGKTSVAVSFFEEGWASIFCAEPALSPALLRELLGILEIRLYYKTDYTGAAAVFYDAVYFGRNLLAIHARETGERVLDVVAECDIQDLLSPEIGWQRKCVITLPLKTGDTRLLHLNPIAE